MEDEDIAGFLAGDWWVLAKLRFLELTPARFFGLAPTFFGPGGLPRRLGGASEAGWLQLEYMGMVSWFIDLASGRIIGFALS